MNVTAADPFPRCPCQVTGGTRCFLAPGHTLPHLGLRLRAEPVPVEVSAVMALLRSERPELDEYLVGLMCAMEQAGHPHLIEDFLARGGEIVPDPFVMALQLAAFHILQQPTPGEA